MKHLTVAEVSRFLRFSERFITNLLEDEPGVIRRKIKTPGKRGRPRTVLLIPRRVYQRWIKRHTV